MVQQHVASLALLRKIKELDASIITMIGAANCEGPMGRATTKQFPWVDFAMSGEADLVFPAACETLCKSGLDVKMHELPHGFIGAPHRYSGDEYERIVAAPPRALVMEMDRRGQELVNLISAEALEERRGSRKPKMKKAA